MSAVGLLGANLRGGLLRDRSVVSRVERRLARALEQSSRRPQGRDTSGFTGN
jgi:hypothetical protein